MVSVKLYTTNHSLSGRVLFHAAWDDLKESSLFGWTDALGKLEQAILRRELYAGRTQAK